MMVQKVGLSDLRGHYIVLYFYPRAGTSGCTREARKFNELYDEFKKLGAVVLGISNDRLDKIGKFAKEIDLRFKLLLFGNDGEVAKLYVVFKISCRRISAQRVTYVIDPESRIIKILKNTRLPEKHADLSEILNGYY